MKTSQAGIDLIMHFEGFSASVYTCPAGYPTIGYGHRVYSDEVFDGPISKNEAEQLLRDDLRTAEQGVNNLVAVKLSKCQFDALVSFTYNLGVAAFKDLTLLKKVNAKDNAAVPAEFKRWVYSRGKKLPGLIKRRNAEAELYMS